MRLLRILTFLAIGMTVSSSVLANPLRAVWRDFNLSYHRNRCWPHPFVDADNLATRAPFGVMMDNGWRLQNLISSYHFEQQQQAMISEAGQRQIHWILTQAPQHHRVVYVQRGMTPQETAARMSAVREVAQRVAGQGTPIDVRETGIAAQGWAAQYVDAINVKFNESTPEPRLQTGSTGFETK